MLARGLAYHDYTTPDELDALREAQIARGEKPRYDGRWRPENARRAGRRRRRCAGDAVPQSGRRAASCGTTRVKGRIEIANAELDDLVIARSDGTPTYNFCVVVDDIEMAITHVIRGDDHVNNTPRQINILRALGAAVRCMATCRRCSTPDGEKLSKRHGARACCSTGTTAIWRMRWSTISRASAGRTATTRCSRASSSCSGSISTDCRRRRRASIRTSCAGSTASTSSALPPKTLGPMLATFLARPGIDADGGPPTADVAALLRDVRPRWSRWPRRRAISTSPCSRIPALLAQHVNEASRPALAKSRGDAQTSTGRARRSPPLLKSTATKHGLKPPQVMMAAARAGRGHDADAGDRRGAARCCRGDAVRARIAAGLSQ